MDFFFFLRKITRGLNEKLLAHSEAAALCSCSDSAESPSAADNAVPGGSAAQGAYSGAAGPGIPARVLWKLGALFSPQTLISIWQFVVAFCCSPASVCFTILLQRRLPNMLARRGSFFSCLGPTSVMWTGRLRLVIVRSE